MVRLLRHDTASAAHEVPVAHAESKLIDAAARTLRGYKAMPAAANRSIEPIL
jgi:hypothetical protein